MCAHFHALEKQVEELRQLLARGFGQLAKSSDPAMQQASLQVIQTLRAQSKRDAFNKSRGF